MKADQGLNSAAQRFEAKGDPRSLAVARTLRELAGILGGEHEARSVAAGFIRLNGLYWTRATTDPERARGQTCWDVGHEIEAVLGAEHLHGANEQEPHAAWGALLEGYADLLSKAPQDARPRLLAIMTTLRRELGWLAETLPPIGGFTPRREPTNPAPASFEASGV